MFYSNVCFHPESVAVTLLTAATVSQSLKWNLVKHQTIKLIFKKYSHCCKHLLNGNQKVLLKCSCKCCLKIAHI